MATRLTSRGAVGVPAQIDRRPLTEARIRRLGPGEFIAGGVEGLVLRISGGRGAARWRLRYTDSRGKRRVYTIGIHSPDSASRATPHIGLETARAHARTLRVQLAKGVDPISPREARRRERGRTIADLLAAYSVEHVDVRCTEASRALHANISRRLLLPAFGEETPESLTYAKVVEWHAAIGAPPPRGLGHGPEANRALAILRASLEWGVRQGIISDPLWRNPCVRVRKFAERSKVREVLSSRQLAALYSELAEAPGRRKGVKGSSWVPQHVCDAIELLAKTGMRRAEVCKLRWADVDLVRGLAILPTSKTGASERPLSRAACQLLKTVAERALARGHLAAETPVCADARGRSIVPQVLTNYWIAIRKRIGVKVGLHALRHGVATQLLESGARTEDAAKALGHRTLATTARYIHDGVDRAREALDRAQEQLGGAAGRPALSA